MVINKFFQSSQKYLSKLFKKDKPIAEKKINKNINAKQTRIYAHLLEKGSINVIQAVNLYEINKLSSIIYNLKKIGEKNNSFIIIKEKLTYIDDSGKPKKCINYIFQKLQY